MNLPESFKTDDQKAQYIEEYENKGGSDPDVVQRMMDIPVAGEPEPETLPEDEDLPPVPMSQGEPSDEPSGEGTPAPAPSEGDLARNWTISEEDIPKEEYFDRKEGRKRRFITHKTPQDLFKTVINEQKRIHYLEDVLLPQTEERVKGQYEPELQRLREELARLKKGQPAPAPAQSLAQLQVQPTPAPAPQQSQQPIEAGNLAESNKELADAIEDLKGINPETSIEHTDKMHKALNAALSNIANLQGTITKIQQQNQQVSSKFNQFEQQQQTEAQRQAAERKQRLAEEKWNKAVQLVDSFATTNPDFRAEYGDVGQSFKDMTRDATAFHMQLAALKFNKHPDTVTNQETMAAAQDYLAGSQDLQDKMEHYGFEEPKNYRAWAELDQIDAMRTGMYRDPNTKKWVHMVDPVSGQPVHLGDMDTAYGRYLDLSGKRQAKQTQKLKAERQSMSDAISRRDTGLVSMDTNQLRGDASADVTLEQANQILEQVDPEMAMAEYMRTGNREQLDLVNRALKATGHGPIEVPDLSYQVANNKAGQ